MLQRHSAWATAGTLPTVCKIRNYSSGVGGGMGGELVDWEKGVWIHFKSTKALFFEKLKCPKSISVRADDFAYIKLNSFPGDRYQKFLKTAHTRSVIS